MLLSNGYGTAITPTATRGSDRHGCPQVDVGFGAVAAERGDVSTSPAAAADALQAETLGVVPCCVQCEPFGTVENDGAAFASATAAASETENNRQGA